MIFTLLLFFVTLALYLIWAKFLLEYTRYAIIVITFAMITALLILYKFFQKRYIFSLSFFLGTGLILATNIFIVKKNYIANITWGNYWYNVKHLINSNQKIVSFPENSAWIVMQKVLEIVL